MTRRDTMRVLVSFLLIAAVSSFASVTVDSSPARAPSDFHSSGSSTAADGAGPIAITAAAVQTPCSCNGLAMDCSHRGKVTLSRQEVCPGSKRLDFRDNSLTSFPDTLKLFTGLNLSRNRLRTLPGTTVLNSALKELFVSGNNISGSPDQIRTLTSLEYLDVSLNRLTSLRLVPKPCNLRVLEASANNVSSFEGIQKCSRLTSLYVARNNISSLPAKVFSKMSSLGELGIYSNPLVSVSPDAFIGLRNLSYLYMSDTPLSTIPDGAFAPLVSLRRLYLSGNPHLALSANAFRGLLQLTHLHLRGANLSEIAEGLFAELRSLEVLNLSKNRLQTLSVGAFAGLSSLKDLDLSENQLSRLPQGVFGGLGKLRSLYLENNRLKEVLGSVFTDLNEIEVIELSSNLLKFVPKLRNCCEKVTELSIRNNSIASLSLAQTRALLRLRLSMDLRGNPLRLEELQWAWGAAGVAPFADRSVCSCGGLHLEGGTVQLCFEVACGDGGVFADWIQAAKAAADAD